METIWRRNSRITSSKQFDLHIIADTCAASDRDFSGIGNVSDVWQR